MSEQMTDSNVWTKRAKEGIRTNLILKSFGCFHRSDGSILPNRIDSDDVDDAVSEHAEPRFAEATSGHGSPRNIAVISTIVLVTYVGVGKTIGEGNDEDEYKYDGVHDDD